MSWSVRCRLAIQARPDPEKFYFSWREHLVSYMRYFIIEVGTKLDVFYGFQWLENDRMKEGSYYINEVQFVLVPIIVSE